MLSFCRTPSTGKCKIVQLRSWLESDTNPHRNVGQRAYTKAVWWIIRICARFCSATKPNAVQGYCNYIYCFYSVICSGFCATDAPVEWKWNIRYLFASSFLGELNKRVDEVELAFGSTATQIGDMPMLVVFVSRLINSGSNGNNFFPSQAISSANWLSHSNNYTFPNFHKYRFNH